MTDPEKCFDVVGLGVSTLDLMMVVDELPSGEVVQRAHNSVLQGGGPVATAMVTLARLGSRTAMVDRIGDDWRGQLIRSEFELEGVSTDPIITDVGHTSSIASILVRKADGARAITYSPGDAGELTPSDVRHFLISSCKILHMNGRHLGACLAAAKIAREHGVLVSFDGGANRYSAELRDLVRLSNLCIVARQFAFSFSGVEDVEHSATSLLASGPKIVVITAGVEGSSVFDRNGESFHQPAYEMDRVVDTTGAGDAYHGAFLHGVLNNHSVRKCALLASAVAAMNTQKLGGRSALPSFDEAVAFLSDRGVQFDKEP